MSDKILVAYATKAGSTAEVAEAVGEEVRNMGAEVDVRLAKDVKDLKPYSAVILGSGILMHSAEDSIIGASQRQFKPAPLDAGRRHLSEIEPAAKA